MKMQGFKNTKKIAILSSGLDDRKDRGYENTSKNLFVELSNEKDLIVQLYKGSGLSTSNQYRINNFSKIRIVHKLGNRIGDTFVFEYILFTLNFIIHNFFWRRKYDTYYTQEPRVAKTLFQLKYLLPGKPKICYGMGVSMDPEHYVNIADKIHIVNIEHFENAKAQFPKTNKISLIPNPGTSSKKYHGDKSKSELRNKYGVKTKYVLIAVGAINKAIKRMDYVVDEAIMLSEDWTLILVGQEQDVEITSKAKKYLDERFIHLFVSPEKIPELYYMSDISVLSSFYEGFPNVVLEASQNKVAPLLHDCKRNRWIVQNETDLLIDMSKKGALSDLLNSKVDDWFRQKGLNVEKLYYDNYSWMALRNKFVEFLTK